MLGCIKHEKFTQTFCHSSLNGLKVRNLASIFDQPPSSRPRFKMVQVIWSQTRGCDSLHKVCIVRSAHLWETEAHCGVLENGPGKFIQSLVTQSLIVWFCWNLVAGALWVLRGYRMVKIHFSSNVASKMAKLEIVKMLQLSRILLDFAKILYMGALWVCKGCRVVEIHLYQIQDGRERPFWKCASHNNSSADWFAEIW